MNLNKTLLAAIVAFGLVSVAQAVDAGNGKVTFSGSIIDSPCSIHPDSLDQTVDLGQISKVALKDSGKSTPRKFDIKLEDCSFEGSKNKVEITFAGMASAGNQELLGITGTAKGAGIALTDTSGNLIELGKPTNGPALQDGNNTLSFAAYVQGEGASAGVTEGDFQAVTDFTLAYN